MARRLLRSLSLPHRSSRCRRDAQGPAMGVEQAVLAPCGLPMPVSWAGSCWSRWLLRQQVRAMGEDEGRTGAHEPLSPGRCIGVWGRPEPWGWAHSQHRALAPCSSGLCFSTILSVSPSPAGSHPCNARNFGHGSLVCECSATYCDTLDPVTLPPAGTFLMYESNKAGKRLERSKGGVQRSLTAPGTV